MVQRRRRRRREVQAGHPEVSGPDHAMISLMGDRICGEPSARPDLAANLASSASASPASPAPRPAAPTDDGLSRLFAGLVSVGRAGSYRSHRANAPGSLQQRLPVPRKQPQLQRQRQ
jgi:hypothetical protein